MTVRRAGRHLGVIRLAPVFAGAGFVPCLPYAELFIIGSICMYRTSVHGITFLLFALTVLAAATWVLRPGHPPRAVRSRVAPGIHIPADRPTTLT